MAILIESESLSEYIIYHSQSSFHLNKILPTISPPLLPLHLFLYKKLLEIMNPDSQIKLLKSNIEKLEKLVDDLIDNVDSKKKKIEFLKQQIILNIEKIDQIVEEHNADS